MGIQRLFFTTFRSRVRCLVTIVICCVIFYFDVFSDMQSWSKIDGNYNQYVITRTVGDFFLPQSVIKNLTLWNENEPSDVPSLNHSKEMNNQLMHILLRPEKPIRVKSELLERYRANMSSDFNLFNFSAPQLNTIRLCPIVPPGLRGRIIVTLTPLSFQEIAYTYKDLQSGGHWHPKSCKARDRVAIIIPYKNRDPHLRVLIYRLHSMLSTQQLDYAIFVVEPVLEGNKTFNRGKLINVGTLEAIRRYDFDCMVFHDVDHVPEDDRNIYYCPAHPRHNANAVDKDEYKFRYFRLRHFHYLGGVSTITFEQMDRMNGYSNDFWGWGGEDDEAILRIVIVGYNFTRLPGNITHYKAMNHTKEDINPINPCRWKLIRATKKRYLRDGIRSTNYKTVAVNHFPTHTSIQVDLLEKESRAKLDREIFNCEK